MFAVAITAFKNGNPERLAQPYDPDRNFTIIP
jgi:hypothetical protein